ncbi:MAG: putative SnoaL-like aldol condensation-catalyzing enzyme [Bermanella sp.]|jgi:predicted SnoaL-like aldol condensation-catalyzing enzyme
MSAQSLGKDHKKEFESLVLEFYDEVFMKRNVSICNILMAENYINHSTFVNSGRENFKEYFTKVFKTFYKTGTKVEKIFIDDDLACLYATHWASNRILKLKFKTIDIYRIEDGLLSEHWDCLEGLGMLSKIIFTAKSILRL